MKFLCLLLALFLVSVDHHAQIQSVKQFDVFELSFTGSDYGVHDNPVSEVELITTWKHADKSINIHGFYNGNGKGNFEGNHFLVRFCPTLPGTWKVTNIASNDPKLAGQHEGLIIDCHESNDPGFWEVDQLSAGKRWYKRSNGEHIYFVGNTLYSFLSEYGKEAPTGGNIKSDVIHAGKYYKKIRFSISGDLYPHPTEKPFVDLHGNPTDDGNYSHRPNPKWFDKRVDLAVLTCFENDLIADIIINGPDAKSSRSILMASENGGDNTPILRYMAARYGSYPNVWICLSNEYDIRNPKYEESQICTYGYRIKAFLPYPTPLSVHGNQRDWDPGLNRETPWNDHVIFQNKLKTLYAATDFADKNYWIAGAYKPAINDELAYEGHGDGWSEEDVIEAHLGAFLGASYGSTGFKSGNKLGHYFMGNFSADEHTSSDNLAWMVQVINENISFWNLSPIHYSYTNGNTTGIFRDIDDSFRALVWERNEYVLGTNKGRKNVLARLPKGNWQVKQYDMIKKTEIVVSESASGEFRFDVPNSRAVITHFKKLDISK